MIAIYGVNGRIESVFAHGARLIMRAPSSAAGNSKALIGRPSEFVESKSVYVRI